MKVRDLITILQECDPELPVGTHANNHEYFSGSDTGTHGSCRIVLYHHYAGNHIIIGNVCRLNTNPPNWYGIKPLDGGDPIRKQWETYT